MTTYTFEKFAEVIRGELHKRLPDMDITENVVVKVNDLKNHGITARKHDSNIAPTIYIDGLYREYSHGRSMNEIVDAVIEALTESEISTAVGTVSNETLTFDSISDKLTIRLLDRERNREYLKTHPCREIGAGLVITADITVDEDYCITVTNDMAENFDIDDMFDTAITNSMREYPARLESVEDAILGNICGNALTNGTKHIEGMNTLRSDRSFGASAISYPMIAERIHELFGSDYFILPSSMHELILIADDGCFSAEALGEMVRQANQTVVEPYEVLSDNVFRYSAEGLQRVA